MNYGKGALKTPKEIRDKHFRLGATPALLDWNTPYMVENGFTLIQRDQKSSSSCTSQATCYYDEALDSSHKQSSARFSYSQNHFSGGGAYIFMPMKFGLNPGFASGQSVPDEDSLEATMEDGSLNKNAIIQARGEKYTVIPRSNIDQMAQIVKDYQGFVTGFNGQDGMFTSDGTANVFTGLPEWGHAVYVCGYEIRNGKKCLKFKNSWSANWGDGGYGYFTEDFVNSGLMFDCYVYADVTDIIVPMTQEEVKLQYALSFYREPTPEELAFWTGKDLLTFLKTAVSDRSAFLAKELQ